MYGKHYASLNSIQSIYAHSQFHSIVIAISANYSRSAASYFADDGMLESPRIRASLGNIKTN